MREFPRSCGKGGLDTVAYHEFGAPSSTSRKAVADRYSVIQLGFDLHFGQEPGQDFVVVAVHFFGSFAF